MKTLKGPILNRQEAGRYTGAETSNQGPEGQRKEKEMSWQKELLKLQGSPCEQCGRQATNMVVESEQNETKDVNGRKITVVADPRSSHTTFLCNRCSGGKMEPEKIVTDYLQRVEDEEGYARITHSNNDGSPCQYSYWHDRDKYSCLCYRVNFQDLVELNEVRVLTDKIILWQGSSDEVTLPIEYDIGKIRRRLEDHLRKTTPEEIIRLAMRAGVKLS